MTYLSKTYDMETDLGSGITAAEEYQTAGDVLLSATLSHKNWPSVITVERSDRGKYLISSDMALPSKAQGTYSSWGAAYDAIRENCPSMKLKIKPKRELSLVEKIELKEREAEATVETWSERYRDDRVYVYEARLKDGSSKSYLTVPDLELSYVVHKDKSEMLYTVSGDNLPHPLAVGKYTTVKAVASALNDYLRSNGHA